MNGSMLYPEVSKITAPWSGWLLALACITVPAVSQADISQEPLFLGGGGIPGNMILVPSVEWPTIESVANVSNTYTAATPYAGYFDSNKCYIYVYSSTESDRYFKPKRLTTSRQCSGSGSGEWSGNFLNWATTQTIDPFRKILTGGLRFKDTETETWLAKARHPEQGGGFPIRELNNTDEVAGAIPFSTDRIRVRIGGLGTEMRFSLNNYDYNKNPKNYEPVVDDPEDTDRGYEMSVRVSVCDDSVGVEENCRQYADNWKPEGLIQQNSESIRFSVFGYLNDSNIRRDGGVLRARQKYVGPRRLESGTGYVDNAATEWDPDTGIFVQNPDSADATATSTSIVNSGVINYLNKFGQLNTGNNKSFDPVSELYYAATRYLKNQGNVSEYSSMGTANAATRARWRDGFPVITDWDDPIQYACQANVFLGIGDANTHRDKNLPGNGTFRNEEPNMPGQVSLDTTVDVRTQTARVAELEGLGNIGETNDFSGRNNSTYMAGLAWDNHVRDIRPLLPGVQSASTHWVDVLENRFLEAPNQNQYYLATKFGGFRIPDDFDPDVVTALEDDWWHSNGDTLVANNYDRTNFSRPDNYYLAGEADAMIVSLREAFSNIADELQSSSAAVSANSTRLDTNTAVFQGSFNSQRWSGELAAFKILDSGLIETTPSWVASEKLAAITDPAASRNIFTIGTMVEQTDGEYLAETGSEFLWDNLEATQQTALRVQPDATLSSEQLAKDRLNYLRGDRSMEQTQADQSKEFRRRESLLGDIINSNPQFSHTANFGYGSLGSTGAFAAGVSSAYATFLGNKASRDPIVLVGANDGMLHAFDADPDTGGEELFAYVPAGVYPNLSRLTFPGYSHRYYVDGTPRIADALLDSEWATLAVGTTGAGGRSVFVLDVSDPGSFAADDVLWEFSHPDMGYTIQQPAVVALPLGQFGVVVTSGYQDTPQANSYIWILNVNDGSIIRTFEFENSGELGSPLVVDLDRNGVADRIYAGDTQGNLWRLDLDDVDPDNWDAPLGLKTNTTILPLFTDPDDRPITAQLTSAFNEAGDHMVFFGTGSFIRVGENIINAPEIERFYGIIDRGQPITDLINMLAQKIELEGNFGGEGGRKFRVVSNESIDASDDGWYLPLQWAAAEGGPGAQGERVVARAIVRGDRVIFPTLIPDEDPCEFGGNSWLMEVEMETGGRLEYSVFDLDEDDKFDEGDFVNIGTEDDPEWVPTSGFDPDVGIINTPAVITGVDPTNSGDDNEIKVISGSNGQMITVPEAGSQSRGRQAWQQLR